MIKSIFNKHKILDFVHDIKIYSNNSNQYADIKFDQFDVYTDNKHQL